MKKRIHKTRRQLQAEKILIAQKQINRANSEENPLASFNSFHKYDLKDGSSIQLTCQCVKNVSLECKNWILDLMERNMKHLYEKSWGWNAEDKNKELMEDAARYLIATKDNVTVGFSHFRFDLDDGIDVLYCYELQLESSVRRKGLGKFMMQALEGMASKYQLQKIVLTVLKNNPSALSFFHSLGFKLDNTNPPASEKVDYVILSKKISSSS